MCTEVLTSARWTLNFKLWTYHYVSDKMILIFCHRMFSDIYILIVLYSAGTFTVNLKAFGNQQNGRSA